MSTLTLLPSLPSLPPLDQFGQAASDAASSAGTILKDSAKQAAKNLIGISLPDVSILGLSGSQILAVVLGLIFVTIGLLMFREVREPVVSAAKTAVKTAAV